MFGTSRQPEPLSPGTRFRRQIDGVVTELAEVLWVNDEPTGIPHVHYLVQFDRGDTRRAATERRTLSLAAFRNRYGRAVLA